VEGASSHAVCERGFDDVGEAVEAAAEGGAVDAELVACFLNFAGVVEVRFDGVAVCRRVRRALLPRVMRRTSRTASLRAADRFEKSGVASS
jgi:hypothetical protein